MTITRSTGELTREAQDWADARPHVFFDYFTGIKPSTADTATTGYTRLLTMSVGGLYTAATDGFSFGTAVGGVVSRTPSESVFGTAGASGTVGWGRLRTYTDTGASSTSFIREDYSIGLPGSGADMILDDVLIVSGTVYPMGTFDKVCSNP